MEWDDIATIMMVACVLVLCIALAVGLVIGCIKA